MRLYMRRRVLLEKQGISQISDAATVQPEENKGSVEKFTTADKTDAAPQNLTLPNYFVKSSYNSCFDSNAAINSFSANVLRTVLQKGYRFIDMEVCYISSNTSAPIQVCINKSYNDESQQDGSNTFPLIDAVREIIRYGVTMTEKGAANYYEPLFIHIRLKHGNLTDDASIRTFYKKVNEILFSTAGSGDSTDLGNFIYPLNSIRSNSGNAAKLATLTLTQIINSNKKCFIIIDKTNLNESSLVDGTTNVFNQNAIMSGFNVGEIPLYKYDEVRAKDGLYVLNDKDGKYQKETNVTASGDTINKNTFSIAISGNKFESTNFYPYDIAKKYGVQFATMNFAVKDEGLKKYQAIFGDKNKTGFVPMARVIRNAAKDVRSDVKGDIRRGIYIGFGIIGAVGLIYGIYRYGGLANFLRGTPLQNGGGGRSKKASER